MMKIGTGKGWSLKLKGFAIKAKPLHIWPTGADIFP